MEKRILEDIHNDLKDKGLQQSLIAKKMGISKESLTYYLKGDNRIKFIDFYNLVNIVYNDYKVVLSKLKLFMKNTTKRENYKSCIEWSIHNGEFELYEIAIEKEKNKRYGKETVEIYELLMSRNQNKIEGVELFDSLEKIKMNGVKQKEMEALASIITLYVFLDIKKYNTITLFVRSALHKINLMDDGFIKQAYLIRVKEMLAIAYMKDNNVIESEKLAMQIINEIDEKLFPLPVNSMYSLLAELNVFSNPSKSILYIYKALDMFKKLKLKRYHNREKMLKNTHDFIKITVGDFTNLYLESDAEKAYYYAKIGEGKKALKIINNLEIKGELTAHQLFYKALATGSKKDLVNAQKEFYKRGDFYYCKLAESMI